ncbi:MAG: hypothetical protein WC679_12660 [Bacteroidales bacterium]|jgi:hypothetical protein
MTAKRKFFLFLAVVFYQKCQFFFYDFSFMTILTNKNVIFAGSNKWNGFCLRRDK